MIKINFNKSGGLIPVIIQESKTLEILMLGYMNKKTLDITIKDRCVTFWSRSRSIIWKKGKISGNMLQVSEIYTDCDKDALLIKADITGRNICHSGNKSCFYRKLL